MRGTAADRAHGECQWLPVDVQVDPKEEQRPEQDGQDRRTDQPHGVEALEVVVRGCDGNADREIEQRNQPESGTCKCHPRMLARSSKSETRGGRFMALERA